MDEEGEVRSMLFAQNVSYGSMNQCEQISLLF